MTELLRMRMLLAEDNPTDALLLREALSEIPGVDLSLTCVDSIAGCQAELAKNPFDVILLDLGLPDSSGLRTFLAVQDQASNTPIVVLTGLSDEDVGLEAVQLGAQDYLVKGQVEIALLGRVVRYAIERHQLQRALQERRQQEGREREVRSVARLSQPPATQVTTTIYSSAPLRESFPDEFGELMRRYARMLDQALEQRIYKSASNSADGLREMAEDLGFLRAGPRDIIEIHVACLDRIVNSAPSPRAQAYVEEARIAVLELMGHLAAYYRNFYSGRYRREVRK